MDGNLEDLFLKITEERRRERKAPAVSRRLAEEWNHGTQCADFPLCRSGPRLPPAARSRCFRNACTSRWNTGRARLVTMIATSLSCAAFTFCVGLVPVQPTGGQQHPVQGGHRRGLFDLLFFTLGTMLVFSTGIILYASLFTSPGGALPALLAGAGRPDLRHEVPGRGRVQFVGRSSCSACRSSSPTASSSGVPWYFYALLPAFLLGYVLLPGSVSASLCLLLVRYMPRNRRAVLRARRVGRGGGAGGVWLYRVGHAAAASRS